MHAALSVPAAPADVCVASVSPRSFSLNWLPSSGCDQHYLVRLTPDHGSVTVTTTPGGHVEVSTVFVLCSYMPMEAMPRSCVGGVFFRTHLKGNRSAVQLLCLHVPGVRCWGICINWAEFRKVGEWRLWREGGREREDH